MGGFLQSSEQNIDLQSNIGGGIGRYLNNTNCATIVAYGGLLYQDSRYTQTATHQPDQNTIAGLAAVGVELFKFNKTNLTVKASVFPALNQPARVYTNLNVTYHVKFWGNFTWNFSFYGNWDSQPPATFSSSDSGMSPGLGWTFGNQ